jgi:hypothetical protein
VEAASESDARLQAERLAAVIVERLG